jgi:threonine dehydratase
VLRTPLRDSAWLSRRSGGRIRLKLETLQPTFSYKIRGALNAALRLVEDGREDRALVTASAGNHGRALAYAARACGFDLTVYASSGAPPVKIDAMRSEGARVVLCRDYDDAEEQAKAHGAAGKAVFISPYAHLDVIAGAGTVGLEVLEDWPAVDIIVAAVGGGGLISGVAAVASELASAVRVIGVEVAASSPFTAGLKAGRIVTVDVQPTVADGLAGNLDPDTPTFDVVRERVSEVVVVEESDVRSAIAGVVRHEHLVAEGAGATAVAAVLTSRLDVRDRNVAVVLSGANIDSTQLARIVAGDAL